MPPIGTTARCQAAQAKELLQVLDYHRDSVVRGTAPLEPGQRDGRREDTFTNGPMR